MPGDSITLCSDTIDRPAHVCAFFDSRDEKYSCLAPFFTEGIEEGGRVINIVDEAHLEGHLHRLKSAGVPIDRATAEDQFRLYTAQHTYLKWQDDLDGMLDILGDVLQEASDERKTVRVCGEMDWIERSKVSSARLLEYEARANYFVPVFDCTLVCVYDLAHTDARIVGDLMATHSSAIIKGRVRPNPYFVDPDEYLESLRSKNG